MDVTAIGKRHVVTEGILFWAEGRQPSRASGQGNDLTPMPGSSVVPTARSGVSAADEMVQRVSGRVVRLTGQGLHNAVRYRSDLIDAWRRQVGEVRRRSGGVKRVMTDPDVQQQ